MNDNGWCLNGGFTQLMETLKKILNGHILQEGTHFGTRRCSFGDGESLGEGHVSHEDNTEWLMSEAALVPTVKCPLAVY